MYKRGELQLTDLPCAEIDEWNMCPLSGEPGHEHRIGVYSAEEAPPPCAYLPHSCDEWVIGGPEQIQAMIDDLIAALRALEGEK